MKATKLLLVTLLTSIAVTLTACNEKEQKTESTPQTQTSTAPEVTTPATQTEKTPIEQFNSSVKISVKSRTILQNDQKERAIAFVYEIQNLTDKPIVALHWASAYSVNDQILYAQNFPLTFEKPIPAKGTETVTGTVPASNILEQNRELALNPEAQVNTVIGAYQVTFADGSSIVVAKPE
ncbi:hypothetical protein [Rodentibacter caecimuris]|uniref:DUF5067 domain-containing protein n=1 Tax=Rodentibacter caecimuris TaxID=1796644 RepID=A0ABX3KZU9_9PAST|nr:hypothetical protein BKG89_01195 [Rodentibacter heylii]